MKRFIDFFKYNKASLLGVAVGIVVGYIYWYHIACFRGTFPFAAECWVNCLFGALTGGFLVCLVRENQLHHD